MNVAPGTNGTDAVNLTQMNAAVAAAQTTANLALANTATAQTDVNTLNAIVAAQATTISSIEALNAKQNSPFSALQTGQTALSNQIVTNNNAANGGIAAAMAIGGNFIPQDAKFTLSFNLATYRGEQGFSGSAIVKVSDKVCVNAGVAAPTVKGSNGARAGVTLAWHMSGGAHSHVQPVSPCNFPVILEFASKFH